MEEKEKTPTYIFEVLLSVEVQAENTTEALSALANEYGETIISTKLVAKF